MTQSTTPASNSTTKKKSNVKTVAVGWGWHDKDQLKIVSPDFIIDNPRDLLKIF